MRIVLVTAEGEDELFDGDANPRGKTEAPRAYRRLLTEEFGLPSESVFRNSAYVGQLQLEIELDEELRRQISGAGQADYKKAREILRAHYYELTLMALPGDRARRKKQKVEKLEAELNELRAQLDAAREATDQISEMTERKEKLSTEYQENVDRKKRTQEELDALEKHLRLIETRRRLMETQTALQTHEQQVNKSRAEVTVIQDDLKAKRFTLFQNLPDDEVEATSEHLTELKDATKSVQNLTRRLEATGLAPPTLPKYGLWLLPLVSFVLAGAAGGAVGFFLSSILGLIVGVIVLGTLTAAVAFVIMFRAWYQADRSYRQVEFREDGSIYIHHAVGDPFSAKLLSTGAKDQLYLALRLAILDLLSTNT